MTSYDEFDDDCDDDCDCCIDDSDYVSNDEDDEDPLIIQRFFSFEESLKNKGFEYLAQGGFRRVYGRGNIVIKIPINEDGLIDNQIEAIGYRHYRNRPTSNGQYLAPCRLLPNGCLMMVQVVWNEFHSNLPEWASLVDGRQCGPYKGRIVAYDYALDLTDRYEWEKKLGVKSDFFNSEEWLRRRPHLQKFKEQNR